MSKQNTRKGIEGYNHETFIKRLDELRKEAGITSRDELASLIGVDPGTVHRWYRNERKPQKSVLKVIANYFHCDPRFLYLEDLSNVDFFKERFSMEKEQFFENHKTQVAFLESIGYKVKYLPAGGFGDRFGNTEIYSFILIVDPAKKEYYHDEESFSNLFEKLRLMIEKELIASSESYVSYRIRKSITN